MKRLILLTLIGLLLRVGAGSVFGVKRGGRYARDSPVSLLWREPCLFGNGLFFAQVLAGKFCGCDVGE
jgi:hypothetical protein